MAIMIEGVADGALIEVSVSVVDGQTEISPTVITYNSEASSLVYLPTYTCTGSADKFSCILNTTATVVTGEAFDNDLGEFLQ